MEPGLGLGSRLLPPGDSRKQRPRDRQTDGWRDRGTGEKDRWRQRETPRQGAMDSEMGETVGQRDTETQRDSETERQGPGSASPPDTADRAGQPLLPSLPGPDNGPLSGWTGQLGVGWAPPPPSDSRLPPRGSMAPSLLFTQPGKAAGIYGATAVCT